MNTKTRFSISYQISYKFKGRINLSTYWARLRPAPHTVASIASYTLDVDAEPHFINWSRDPYENHLARLDFPERITTLGLNMELVADLEPINPFDFLVDSDAHDYPFDYSDQLLKELKPYLHIGPIGEAGKTWFASVKAKEAYIVDTLGELNLFVHEKISTKGITKPGAINIEDLLSRGHGNPWEIAWLLTLTLRHCGLAARFVSGLKLLADSESKLPDSCSLHAWSEVFLPGAGWIGLDPSGGVFTNEGHIPLATAPDPLRALPLIGYFEACDYEEQSSIQVKRLVPLVNDEDISQSQWKEVNLVAQHVDKGLAQEKIESISSTSLAFTSAANAGNPEWSTSAVGGDKTWYATALLLRLRERIAPNSVMQTGQGEWYSGETLPRWKTTCVFRHDGNATWKNNRYLAVNPANGDCTIDDAQEFLTLLAKLLKIETQFVTAAYEDVLHELWNNRNYLGFTPDTDALNDPERRQALANQLSANRGKASAFVLPLAWNHADKKWTSGKWKFRRNGLYLSPGISPPGFRLPLSSLPKNKDSVSEPDPERCHFEERDILPEIYGELSARMSNIPEHTGEILHSIDEDETSKSHAAPKTALCVDVREGYIHLFLPPISHLEHYLELIAAIETIAEKLQTPVVLEGYEAPFDARILRFSVEPEPGVLKVTLPECASWDKSSEIINIAYEEARQLGLSAERVTIDGRRISVGSRSEISVGGPEPVKSPLLRRPEILRSFIEYWQRHPSLSYLFAPKIIGTGGNAPRADEGRDDVLYELDQALQRIPAGWNDKPWEPDRILRHMLTDTLGDMRRAEIRVDQLFPPESSAMRLGRILIRSFETPPSEKMASLQWLFVRALLLLFSKKPQHEGLIHWGSQLRDKFMLPYFLWQDFKEIVEELQQNDIPIQTDWFDAFLELRFPYLGGIQMGDLTLDLRQAHEPWPLTAEELTPAGNSRFIDSANDRIQVSLGGATPGRYAVICNDRNVPLHETELRGQYVAGVRYKTNNPVSTLHPTVSPTPVLVFDVLDTWTGRIIGGCQYLPPSPPSFGYLGVPQNIVPEIIPGQSPITPPLLPIIAIPQWQSQSGRFVAQGSGRDKLGVPDDRLNPRFPNLLDLTKLN